MGGESQLRTPIIQVDKILTGTRAVSWRPEGFVINDYEIEQETGEKDYTSVIAKDN